jgi:hypothetical protein
VANLLPFEAPPAEQLLQQSIFVLVLILVLGNWTQQEDHGTVIDWATDVLPAAGAVHLLCRFVMQACREVPCVTYSMSNPAAAVYVESLELTLWQTTVSPVGFRRPGNREAAHFDSPPLLRFWHAALICYDWFECRITE